MCQAGMAFCSSAAGLLAAAAGHLPLESFKIGVGVVVEAVWVNLGGFYVDRFWAYIAAPLHSSYHGVPVGQALCFFNQAFAATSMTLRALRGLRGTYLSVMSFGSKLDNKLT